MPMDIRNPFKKNEDYNSNEQLKSLSQSSSPVANENKTRIIVFGVAASVILLLAVVWYVLGAPGAPEAVKKAAGKLPLAGDRLLSGKDSGNGLSFLNPSEQSKAPWSSNESPISGVACANAQRRPIGVMLASDPVNRPLSGPASADAVVEMPVLINNVTRLMAIYQCNEPRELGSVRSTRHPFLYVQAGLDAVVVHWGGSYWALNMIKNEGNVYNSLSALGTGQSAFFRKSNLPAPYNGFTSYQRAWDALVASKYRTKTVLEPYPHVNDASESDRGEGGTLDIGWPGAMKVRYTYNRQTNSYDRSWGGTKMVDALDNVPVSPKVLVVAHTTMNLMKQGEPYVGVGTEGSGKMEIYQNGKVIEGTWQKSTIKKEDPPHFLDASGKQIELVRGQIWIHYVDDASTQVRWTPGSSAPAELDTGTTPANLGG